MPALVPSFSTFIQRYDQGFDLIVKFYVLLYPLSKSNYLDKIQPKSF